MEKTGTDCTEPQAVLRHINLKVAQHLIKLMQLTGFHKEYHVAMCLLGKTNQNIWFTGQTTVGVKSVHDKILHEALPVNIMKLMHRVNS